MNLTYIPVKIAKSNILLITAPVDSALRVQTAGWLLRREKGAEQAVFVTREGDEPRLETADGAMNVSGAMALCAWLASDDALPAGKMGTFSLPCSDGALTLHCAVTPVHNCALVTVTMPSPELFSVPVNGNELPAVRYPGVSCVIVPDGTVARTAASDLLPSLGRTLGTPRTALLFWNEDARILDPLVMERGVPVWRRSSGSAAGALGAYLDGRLGETVSVRMPGGVMAVTRSGGTVTVTAPVEVHGRRAVDLVF